MSKQLNVMDQSVSGKRTNWKALTLAMVEVLARLDQAENMAQVCWIFDHLSPEVKELLEARREDQ